MKLWSSTANGLQRSRCSEIDSPPGKVRYQYSRHGSKEEAMDYLEFIARVTSHIPDKGQVMVRYYGLYSNAHRLFFSLFKSLSWSFLV
jgi:hypothetical protein